MKSLKYSSVSKMKKQKQEQKVQSSILNTLKQDDQICSTLLDTLSDDYLGYLEDLMGKKVNQEQKSSKKQKHVEKQTEILPQYPSATQLEITDALNLCSTTNDFIKPTLVQSKIQPQHLQFVQQENRLQQLQLINKEIKQVPTSISPEASSQINLTKPQQVEKPTQNKTQFSHYFNHKKSGKILIDNIDGYLKSLSQVKPNPYSKQQKIKSKELIHEKNIRKLKNTKQSALNSEISKNSNKHQAQKTTFKFEQKSLKRQTQTHKYGDSDEGFQKYLSKNSASNKLKKNQPNQILMKQTENSENLAADSNQNSLTSQSESHDSEIQYTEHNVIPPNKNRRKSERKDNNSMEQLIVKLITKYNKLSNKQQKYKKKVQHLKEECDRLQTLNNRKDFQIKTLYEALKIQKVNFNNHQLNLGNKQFQDLQKGCIYNEEQKVKKLMKIKEKFFKNPNIQDQNRYLQNQQQNQILKKLDFRKKDSNYGKAINIEKMFIIDNLQVQKRQKQLELNGNEDKFHRYSSQNKQILNLSVKNSVKRKNNNDKEKRSISCRQSIKRKQNFQSSKDSNKVTKQASSSWNKFYPCKSNNQSKYYTFTTKNDEPLSRKNKGIIYNTIKTYNQEARRQKFQQECDNCQFSYKKSSHLQKNKDENQRKSKQQKTLQVCQNDSSSRNGDLRNRAFSESYNSLAYKRRQSINDIKYKFLKSSSKMEYLPNHQQTSEEDQIHPTKKNLKYFANSIQMTKRHDFVSHGYQNQESQTTDVELLEKLLSIQRTKDCHNNFQSYGNKTFFG